VDRSEKVWTVQRRCRQFREGVGSSEKVWTVQRRYEEFTEGKNPLYLPGFEPYIVQVVASHYFD
jgi:hypothetical protein